MHPFSQRKRLYRAFDPTGATGDGFDAYAKSPVTELAGLLRIHL